MEKGKIFVALDVNTKAEALEIVNELQGLGACFKIGKQLFTAEGPELVREIVKMGEDVFLDLKYHDIPNTVAMAGAAAAKLGVKVFNVHAGGGRKMMEAVRAEMNKLQNPPMVLAVTVLTSMAEEDLKETGISVSPAEQVKRLALLAKASGMDGVVASPLEVEMIRNACGPDFKILTPGIRPASSSADDQKRIATPASALRSGSDYLVIGRPITGAKDRRKAFIEILKEIQDSQ
ncbi:MAG TPA: orotidine-5'-phosphate decarboxylase [bacterium]|nr:orotidine-5'-phosphate decarboxylase [bacterium]